MRPPLARRISAGLLLLGGLLASCGPAGRDRPSVVLVTLDTTRWDALGTYGDPDARTPVFDAMARTGLQFRNAFVDAPTTLPSHATMFTGAISVRHGVRLNDVFLLPEAAKTLAEIYAERGWSTAAVISSVTLDAERGLDQGFALYDDTVPAAFEGHDPTLAARTERFVGVQRRAHETTAAAARAVLGLKPPAFLWVHYVDAHLTYDPPPPWSRIPGLGAYAGEIAHVDREMGRMLRDAEEALGPVIVAILSDHGEGLGDHREDEHGMFLYDSTIRIPFVLAGPRIEARIESASARNVDLAPTLLASTGITGVEFPDGVVLTAGGGGAGGVLSESLTPTRFHGGSRIKALRRNGLKYVLAPRPELYDVEADPGETRNLLGELPDRDERLRRALAEVVTDILRDPGGEVARVSPVSAEQEEALRALGYIGAGSAVPTAPDTVAMGIDPKDLIDVTRALRYVMDGRYDEARPRMARFWQTHEAVPADGWRELYSRAHLCQAFLELTDLDRETGHLERARRHLAAALEYAPGYEDALGLTRRLDELEGQ